MRAASLNVLSASLIALLPSDGQAQDWSGPYAALGITAYSGDYVQLLSGVPSRPTPHDGNAVSVAIGYNQQRGNLVFGGELGYSPDRVDLPELSDRSYGENVIDVKARVGYAAGRALFYGTVGWAKMDRFFSNSAVTNEPISADGLSFGLGVELRVSDSVFVGLEVQRRNLKIGEGEIDGFPNFSHEHDLQSVGLRVGFSF